MESLTVSIGWRRPSQDNAGNWMEDIAQSCLHATVREVPWLGICDWNLAPEQNPLVMGGAGVCAVHDLESELIPSRWASGRCIDYAVSNLTDLTGLRASFAEERVSDHKILHLRGQLNVSTEVGRLLKPTRDCSKPPDIPQADWRKALEEEWAHVSAPAALGADEEWRCFNLTAERCALRAKAKLEQPPPRGGICRPKGSLPELLKERAATKSSGEALEAMAVFWKRIWNRDALPEELQRLRWFTWHHSEIDSVVGSPGKDPAEPEDVAKIYMENEENSSSKAPVPRKDILYFQSDLKEVPEAPEVPEVPEVLEASKPPDESELAEIEISLSE
eukprot:s4399_g4.t1